MKFNEYFPIKKHIDHYNKNLGQHFLTDRNILQKISDSIDVETKNLVEIGGGIGNLTVYLREKSPKSYEIIEKDKFYAQYLTNLFPEISVRNEDCLNYNKFSDVIVGNLPYNIATEFMIKIMVNNQFKKAIFLIQKEVAERMTSVVRSKSYGSLSVITQLLTKPKILFDVSGNSFYPKPNVTSSLILLERNEKLMGRDFLIFLKNAFIFRRKKYFKDLCPDQISPEIYETLFNNHISKKILPENQSQN